MEFLLLISAGAILIIIVSVYLFKKIAKKDDLLLPDLSVTIVKEDSLCAVKLINKGKGTAVIKDINFWNCTAEEVLKKSIDEVFPINKAYWINNTDFCCDKDYFLASGDSIFIGKLKKERVLQNGGNFNQTARVFDEKVKEMKIKIEYSDVFSHKLSPFIFNN